MHFLGRNALMAKLDIKEAYRIVPIHPDDRRFLGVCWQGQVYVDCQLPFGLASAPAIFSALGEALEWILRQRGVKAVIHYIDDFLLLGACDHTSDLPGARGPHSPRENRRPRYIHHVPRYSAGLNIHGSILTAGQAYQATSHGKGGV